MLRSGKLGTFKLGASESEDITAGYGQAQAKIISSDVNRHSQSQAQIKQTYAVHGQAQALLGVVNTQSGQAQAQIKQTYRVYAQSQADIKQIYSSHGQAQATIVAALTYGTGQAQTSIVPQYIHLLDTFSRIIDPTGFDPATLGPSDVGAFEYFLSDPDVSSSGTRLEQITVASNDFVNMYAVVDVATATISVDFFSSAYHTSTLYYEVYIDNGLDKWAIVYFEEDGGSLRLYLEDYNGSSVNSVITLTNAKTYRLVLFVTPTDVKVKVWDLSTPEPISWTLSISTDVNVNFIYWLFDHGFVSAGTLFAVDNFSIYSPEPPIYQKFGQAQASIVSVSKFAHGQARARIKSITRRHGQARAYIRLNAGFGQARAHIKTVGVNKSGQAQAYLGNTKPTGQAQATIDTQGLKAGNSQAWIENSYVTFGQAQALIELTRRKQGQAQAYIEGMPVKHGQAMAYIYRSQGYGQAMAFIAKTVNSGQSQAIIKAISNKYGQAMGFIAPPSQGYGQSQAKIIGSPKKHGQASAYISYQMLWGQANALIRGQERRGYGQSQALIIYHQKIHGLARAVIVKPTNVGQAQAKILAYGQRATGLSRAFIRRTDTYTHSGQTRAQIRRNDPVGQAQALIIGGRYLIKYNGYQLPGYAQSESFDSVTRVHMPDPSYVDGPFGEYIGLNNKIISLQMKVVGRTYLDVKTQAQKAATIVRSSRGWTKLYVQSYDRYYTAINKNIDISKVVGESMRLLDYSMEFEAKPWLTGDEVHTITGSGLISTDQVGRTYEDGGWTPANLILSGTNITVSGYTESGEFTGFVSVSGTVTNMIINSEQYTATVNGVNSNDQMYNANYMVFIGPGKTYFAINGATSCTIVYQNRWHL